MAEFEMENNSCFFERWKKFVENWFIHFQAVTEARAKPAMGNLRPAGRMRPFEFFNAALLKPLKYVFFIEKSTISVEKACTLALDINV
jgi:hypothetical protein